MPTSRDHSDVGQPAGRTVDQTRAQACVEPDDGTEPPAMTEHSGVLVGLADHAEEFDERHDEYDDPDEGGEA